MTSIQKNFEFVEGEIFSKNFLHSNDLKMIKVNYKNLKKIA